MRRALLSVVLLTVVLLLQLTFVNRLALPGGAGLPNLVLLTVVALGLFTSPLGGAVTGFFAGLALDLAPPGSYLIGEYALVLCILGYLCGRARAALPESAAALIGTAAVAAVAGEVLSALVGRVISAPAVSWSAVQNVLPSAVIYDVVLAPFVLYGVMRAVRWADGLLRAPETGTVLTGQARPALAAGPAATVLGGAGRLGGSGWVSGPGQGGRLAGRHPRSLRLRAGSSRPGDGWVGHRPGTAGLHAPARPAYRGRPPRLRLSAAHRPGPIAGHPGAAAARRRATRGQPDLRLGSGRRRDGTIGRPLGLAGGAGALPRTGPGIPGSAFRTPKARLAGQGGPARSSRGPKFRPGWRLPGGSAAASAAGRGLRTGGSRPPALRLGSRRRGDGMLAGLAPHRTFSARRQAAPRFRTGPSLGLRVVLLAGMLRLPRRRTRFGSGRRPARGWASGRSGGRSAVWRIGSTKRIGGL